MTRNAEAENEIQDNEEQEQEVKIGQDIDFDKLAQTMGDVPRVQPPALIEKPASVPQNILEEIQEESTDVQTIPGLYPTPFHVEPPKEPKGKGGRTRDVFKDLVPPTDSLLIFKIDNKGHKGYVGAYSSADLERSQGIEMFLRDNLVPTWGAGDYVIEVRDSSGKVKKQGLVPMPAPIVSPLQKDPHAVTLQDILAAQQQMQATADKKAAEQFTNFTGMMSMFKEMMPKGENKGGDSFSSMMPMMMMMQMMQQQQRSSGPDPVMQMLLQKVIAQQEHPIMPPPLPMPPFFSPPPVESGPNVADMIKVVVEAIKSAQPQTQNNDLLTSLITTVVPKLMAPDRNVLTAKDIVELLPTFKQMVAAPKEGASTFNDYLEGLMKLDEIRGGGGENSSIWAGLAEMVAGVFRDIKMQQMKLDMLQKARVTPTTAQRMQQLRRIQQQKQVIADASEAPTLPKDEQEKSHTKIPVIPVSFSRYAARMRTAFAKNDPQGLIMAFMEGLLHLRETSTEWAPYIEEMMVAAASGDKIRALRFTEVFLHSFAKKKLISVELVGATKKLMDETWDQIIKESGISTALQGEEAESEPAEPTETVEETDDDDDEAVDPSDYDIDEDTVAETPKEPEQPIVTSVPVSVPQSENQQKTEQQKKS